MNIIDYITWRGDLSFEQSPFCQVDELILARISYFDFNELFQYYEEEITIEEAYNRFSKGDLSKKKILIEGDIDLFPAMAKCKRFKSCRVTRFVNNIVDEQRTQFAAITVIFPNNDIYVSFRGTDNTIVGWREDLDMSFQDSVPCQLEGVKYLEEIARNYTTPAIRVGGHSKGGNIAIYASSFSSYLTKQRIINIYNNDGPGLSQLSSEKQEYKDIVDRIQTYVPQSSVIGRMLSHKEKYTVVLSDEKGLMQHDVYSWQILGPNFVTLEEVDDGSEFVDDTLTEFLQKSSPEQREKTLDIVFELLYKTNSTTIREINSKKLENYTLMLKEYNNLDKETKQIVQETANVLFGSAKEAFIDKYSEKVKNSKKVSKIESVQKQLKEMLKKGTGEIGKLASNQKYVRRIIKKDNNDENKRD